jgi:hypothetical protein
LAGRLSGLLLQNSFQAGIGVPTSVGHAIRTAIRLNSVRFPDLHIFLRWPLFDDDLAQGSGRKLAR